MMANNGARSCAICGEATVEKKVLTQQFAYANGSRDVLLTADIPVEFCSSCGETLVGEEGEIARHEAVCRYLGRLTPLEVKSIRRSLSMTQKEFASRLDIGVASLKRWEIGSNIQSKTHDMKIRKFSKNDGAYTKRFTPVFRTPIKEYMMSAAERFELRPQE